MLHQMSFWVVVVVALPLVLITRNFPEAFKFQCFEELRDPRSRLVRPPGEWKGGNSPKLLSLYLFPGTKATTIKMGLSKMLFCLCFTIRPKIKFQGGYPVALFEPPADPPFDSTSQKLFLSSFRRLWESSIAVENKRVPNPPGANPLVAERAFPTSDYWGRTGVARCAEEMTGICRDFQ